MVDRDRRADLDLPIACSLTPAQLETRKDGLRGFLEKAVAREPITDGFRWQFESSSSLLKEAGNIIAAEHECCRFLRFLLLVEPGQGAIWLEVTGPGGTAEFLSSLVDLAPDEKISPTRSRPSSRKISDPE